ncbi:MAG TPA: ATP-binding protein [Candidatus Peribacteraceae bacterium]|nr:ATP-binding protein [Candidatus Peribacteraceae bacterium]
MSKSRQRRSTELLQHRSFLWRVAAYMLLLAALTVGTLSFSSFFIARSYVERATLAQLSSLVAAKEDSIEERLRQDREYAVLVTSRREVLRMVDTGESEELAPLFAQLLHEEIPVVGMTLFSADGTAIGSVGISTSRVPPMAARTKLVPLTEESGWAGYNVFVQVRDDADALRGFLALRYEVSGLLVTLLSVDTLGDTAETLIGEVREGELVLLHYRSTDQFGQPLFLGPVEDQYAFGDVLALALSREEGVREAEDYRGKQVFAAYRYLPTLGWGLVVKVDTRQALSGVFALGATLAIVSLVLLILTALLSVVIAHNVTSPLRRLSRKVLQLGPGRWGYHKSVHTGDEVEMLDRVTADLASRLKVVYENLEEEVRVQTEAQREEYEKAHTILESIQHGIVVVDKKGMVLDQNAAADGLIGCDKLACLGKPVQEVLSLHLHKRPVEPGKHPVLECLRKKVSVRTVPEVRWSILHEKNGVLIPITLSVTPILDGKKLLGAIAVFYDITEERRVDYLKSEFISLASHQLRTPLSTLQWYIELLTSAGEKKLPKEQREYLKEMGIASKRMARLVDALLHAARLEGQTIKPDRQRIDLKEFMEDMAEELRSLAKASKIACVMQIPDKQYFVSTDAILLHIVLQNLFSNSVKYTLPGGQVNIALHEGPSAYEITVSDTGIGIPKGDQKRIFERLFRADNVRQLDTDGSGLGLYISRMVMDNLGGSIRFKSSEEKGTAFTISLPRRARKTPKRKSSEFSR